jgi:hypothetical protein
VAALPPGREGAVVGKRGKQGTATSVVSYSPGKLAAMERGRQRQEERWAAKAGPVTVRMLTAGELRDRPRKSPGTSPFRMDAVTDSDCLVDAGIFYFSC